MVAHSGESPGAMPRLVKSEKVKTQRRVDNNSEQNNKRHKLSRVIHSGAVNDRTQHGIPATSETPGVTVVLCRYIRAQYLGSHNTR